jgi:ankyrin repeat protein
MRGGDWNENFLQRIGNLMHNNRTDWAIKTLERTIQTINRKGHFDKTDLDTIYSRTTLLITAVDRDKIDMMIFLLKNGANKEKRNDEGITPLMVAVILGNYDATRLLLNEEADINAKADDTGNTPLILAVQQEYSKKNSKMMKLLLKPSSDPKCHNVATFADKEKMDNKGRTPLMIAVIWGNYNAVRLLLNEEADINAKADDTGNTPLILAVKYLNSKMVKLLLNPSGDEDGDGVDVDGLEKCRKGLKGANVNIKNNDHKNAYDIATSIQENNIETDKLKQNLREIKELLKTN